MSIGLPVEHDHHHAYAGSVILKFGTSREPRHRHDFAGQGHHETSSSQQIDGAHVEWNIDGRALRFRVIGEGILGLGHADVAVSVTQLLVVAKFRAGSGSQFDSAGMRSAPSEKSSVDWEVLKDFYLNLPRNGYRGRDCKRADSCS